MTDERLSAYSRLRLLQEQNLANIPANIAQRAVSTFTLDAEPEPEGALRDTRVVVYPQDPFVGQPEVRRMHSQDIRGGLINLRVRIRDSADIVATPDEDGSYLYWPDTPEFDQVNTFYYTTFTLRMHERYARRDLPWAFPAARIEVDPHAGDGANAFYNERDRLIGFYSFQVDGKTFNAAQSADVVSHETAHAILDGIRDLHNESFGLGPTAFHESFGDMTAVLVSLHDDSLINRLLEWTKGDLRMNNFISAVAENVAHGLSVKEQAHAHEHTLYLRNAFNSLKSLPFDEIPLHPKDPETELARESHNYSRLFTGAFYDILVGMYEDMSKTMPPLIAITRTRDVVGRLLICAVELGPVGEFDFSDMAKAFLAADQALCDGCYGTILTRVFDQRGILSSAKAKAFLAEQKALPHLKLPKTLNSSLAAALFLEEKALPALKLQAELTPLNAYRNAAGQAYLTYFTYERLSLQGEQYRQFDGASVDVFGGLTLMFDKAGKLCSSFYRPVTDENRRQIRILTQELIERGLIADPVGAAPLTQGPMHLQDGEPKGLWIPELVQDSKSLEPPQQTKLVKFPVIFDRLHRPMSDFLSYLRSWQDKRD